METKRLSPTPLPVTLAVVILLAFILAGTALANAGPHGNYSATTDACAGCHRAHSAGAAKLLIDAVPALCFSCHGSSGTGADTNVDDGVYSPTNDDLLGGGFVNFQGAPTSSSHSIDGSWQNAWGSGTTWVSTYDCAGCHNPESGLVWPGIPQWGISPNAWPTFPGRGQNVTMPLTCTSCHEPHGGRNYRLLQQRMHPDSLIGMQQEDPPGYVLVTSNETGGQNPDQPGYVPDYTTPRYRLGLGDWCTGCHFTYHLADSIDPWDGTTIRLFNAEDGQGLVRRYRHKMNIVLEALTTNLPLEDPSGDGASADDQLFCATCHYAHGTNISVSTLASVAPTNDSALLRIDNRGVCEDCHQK